MTPKQFITLIGILCLPTLGIHAQHNDDPVLFFVEDTPVHVSEFTYIYSKTNQDKADFSRGSLEEYLNLYTNFKLKVRKARDLQLDTVPETKNELEGYRRQLANSYLVDREVTDKLAEELYQHMQQDVDIDYIFVASDQNAPAADTLRAFQRANRILQLLKNGADFGQVAADSSEDNTARENRGHLGFVTAMLPDGYYAMEKAIYNAKPGDILGPIRTAKGYNIVRVNAFRPARGEMEVAHILVRKGKTPEEASAAKIRIDSAYAALQTGASWEEVCSRFSDDKTTAPKGGYIGFFGINRYQKTFEDAAFALEKDLDYTRPVETTIGWHIIRRMSRRPIGEFETMKKAMVQRIKRDSRNEIATQAMVERIQKEGNYQEFPAVLNAWAAKQHDTLFHTFKWRPDDGKPNDVMFRFGNDRAYTLAEFEQFCSRAGRERMRGKGYPVEETIAKLYKEWNRECAFQFEETQLYKKYPEFRSLMREYEEGILLFEAAKQLVWDRANTDSTGLEQYFNQNLKGKYKWDERARVTFYTIKTDDPKTAQKIRDFAAKKSTDEVLKKFNKAGADLVATLEKTYEKGRNKDLDGLWKSGAMSEPKSDSGTKTTSFIKVEEIIPASPKELKDARGYAVADYQDYLEKQWVENLKKEYTVKVNQDVFNRLVRK